MFVLTKYLQRFFISQYEFITYYSRNLQNFSMQEISISLLSQSILVSYLNIVYEHSKKWRYRFNPNKSAILVYGESPIESATNSKYRMFRLGKNRIKEETSYDHLGLKNNSLGRGYERTAEKISKGRKALNAASGLGLKPGGLTIQACSLLFWSMVIPITTYACELWVMSDEDIKLLEDFQVYSGRRVKRFHQSSPRETSYAGLGWIRIELFVYIKKLLFVRNIANLKEDSIYRKVFNQRQLVYANNKILSRQNKNNSPTFDILRISEIFDIYEEVNMMLHGTRYYTKSQWKELVWSKAWDLDRQDWHFRKTVEVLCI